MARLPRPASLTHDDRYGWTLHFWGEACDFTIPFRPWLDEIARRLGGVLSLPAWVPDEDFIDGSLSVEGETIAVYYEFSLGYLSLAHPGKATMSAIRRRLTRPVDPA